MRRWNSRCGVNLFDERGRLLFLNGSMAGRASADTKTPIEDCHGSSGFCHMQNARELRHECDTSEILYNSLLAITLNRQKNAKHCGFILPSVAPSPSRNPSAARRILDSVLNCQLPPFFSCRDYADRHGCEPNDRSIRTRTAQEAEASLVQN